MKLIEQQYKIIGECPSSREDSLNWIEVAGRVCFQSQPKGEAEKFVMGLANKDHTAMLEHSNIVYRTKHKCSRPVHTMEMIETLLENNFLNYTIKNDQVYVGGNWRAWVESQSISTNYTRLPDISFIMNFPEMELVQTEDIPLALKRVMVIIKTSRAVTHELVRHRPCSFCLSGDTLIHHYDGKKSTIKKLYEYSLDQRKGRLKLIDLVGMNSDGELIPVKIKSVIKSGKKKVYELITTSGRKIKASAKHRFYTENGWKRLNELSVNDTVYSNGINVMIVFKDKIAFINYVGKEETYDIEIDNECHNFIANGLVVHNSQESQRYCAYKDELEFIVPVHYMNLLNDTSQLQNYRVWTHALENIELDYKRFLENGEQPQEARHILPNCTSTQIVMTTTVPHWNFIFSLRDAKTADPNMQILMKPLHKDFADRGWSI